MRFESKWIHKLTTSLPAPTRKLPVPNKTAGATIAPVAAGAATRGVVTRTSSWPK